MSDVSYKPAPTPWSVEKEQYGYIILDKNGEHICSDIADARRIPHAPYREDALHIVKCVNEHEALTAERDALREALERVVKEHEHYAPAERKMHHIAKKALATHNQQGE